MNWEQPENRSLTETSLTHWLSFQGALQGYSFTGAASISAQMLRAEDALTYLNQLMDQYILANTMYEESGPVIETPLSAAQSMHDMVCQSWGGVIRVFPAVPGAWADLAVRDFRTQGAFLLSASREGGRTRWVRLLSEAGAPCVVRHSIPGEVEVRSASGAPVAWHDLGDGTIRIELRRGREAFVTARGDRPPVRIAPVAPNDPSVPPWGLPG